MSEVSSVIAPQPPLPEGHQLNPLASAIARTRAVALRAPPKMSLVEWADKHRYLSSEASSTGGKWRTSRVEVARGVMMAFSEPGVTSIATMVSVQLLKTEFQLNIIGYRIHLNPGPTMVVLPDADAAKKWSQDRLEPMIRDTPVLRSRVDARPKSAGNTWARKAFPGGQVNLVSAHDPAAIAQLPEEVVLFDEIDKFPVSSGREGDPIDIALERMTTYDLTKKAAFASSPTIKGKSQIEAKFLEGDQRLPFVPCPKCGHEHVLRWKHIDWEKDVDDDGNVRRHHPETAGVRCENSECRHLWTEAERHASFKKLSWRQTRPFECCGVQQDPQVTRRWEHVPELCISYATCSECGKRAVSNEAASFHAWKVHSPWEPLSKLVKKFLKAKDDPYKLMVFVNTQLGEPWEDSRKFETSAEALAARREIYPSEIPSGVGIITMGVDTQDNRLEYEIVGWGVDEESWSIDRGVIAIDPADPEAWRQLDEVRTKPRTRADGRSMTVTACCVDYGGHRSEHVSSYCTPRSGQNVWAVRGKNENSDVRAPIWPRKPTVRTRGRVPLYEVGTQAAKDMLFSRLGVPSPGPGYMHFPPHYDIEAFEQLVVERLVRKTSGSRRFQIWECPNGKRNESTDCRVYAMAALAGLKSKGMQVNRAVLLTGAISSQEPAQLASDTSNLPAPSRPPVPAGGLADRARATKPAGDLETGAKSGKLDVENREPQKPPVKAPVRKPVLMQRRSSRW